MAAADAPGDDVPVIVVPEVRDYTRINAELTRLLDAGHRHVRLAGVDGQRLLAHGLRGDWSAIVVVEGNAGPELAADLCAPGLTVSCTGGARDGAGRGLRSGRLLIAGDADAAVGYAQAGGTIIVHGSSGPRAGLDQSGGELMILGSVDRLAGERQRRGTIALFGDRIGPFSGHGRSGGRILRGIRGHEDYRATLLAIVEASERPRRSTT